MKPMNPIAQKVISKNQARIEEIVNYYENERNQAAFIRIETGIYGRNVITPSVLPSEVIEMEEGVKKIFEAQALSPYAQIDLLTDKSAIYKSAYSECQPGTALICIDYESEGDREYFDPIVFPIN